MLVEIILEAWVALKRNVTRSLLTMLGIVWGIATVTLLIAYGNSFRSILVHGFDAFGKSVVICWPQQTSEQPGGQRAGKKVVIEQADVDMVKAIRLDHKHDFDGVLIPDHTPAMECAAPWHAGMAYALGWMRAAVSRVEAE